MINKFHNDLKKQFLALMNQLNENCDIVCVKILDYFFEVEQHHSVRSIYEHFQSQNDTVEVDLKTIEMMLKTFVKYGIARTLKTDDGKIRYEHLHVNEHHDHLICTKCGRIFELKNLELEQFQEQITLQNKFYPFYHSLQIYGICNECLGKRKTAIPLTLISIGETVRIEKIIGGQRFIKRLNDMGLQKGNELKLLNNSGALIILIGKTRLAIGRGMAKKIIVSPIMSYHL